MYESKVLIVGAGPTGLTLALDLARRRISFHLIEAAATPFARPIIDQFNLEELYASLYRN